MSCSSNAASLLAAPYAGSDSAPWHAGEPFGLLADVDKKHMPDLIRMLNRCVSCATIILAADEQRLSVVNGLVCAGTNCVPRSPLKMCVGTMVSGRATTHHQTSRTVRVRYF